MTTRGVSLSEALGGASSPHQRLSAGLAAATELARRFCPGHTASYGFELPLDSATRPVDFGVCIDASREARRALGECLRARVAAGGADHPAWSAASALACRLADDRDPLARHLSAVFFEFDADERGALRGAPSLFARFRQPLARSHDLPQIGAALSALGAGDDAARFVEDLSALVAAAGCAAVTDVGLMAARSTPSLRASVELLPGDARAALAAGPWRAHADALSPAWRALAPDEHRLRLHLDSVSSALGVEQSFGVESRARTAWRPWLERVAEAKLLQCEEIPELLAWTGSARVERSPRWPFVMRRELGHVKLVFVGERFVRAKAYLVASPVFSLFS